MDGRIAPQATGLRRLTESQVTRLKGALAPLRLSTHDLAHPLTIFVVIFLISVTLRTKRVKHRI
jgi:hypothetical protein